LYCHPFLQKSRHVIFSLGFKSRIRFNQDLDQGTARCPSDFKDRKKVRNILRTGRSYLLSLFGQIMIADAGGEKAKLIDIGLCTAFIE
jgi:hypothetical protein